MILSNAAFNWASLRSGLTLPDFVASLTPEREEEILKQYNEWRRARGLPEDKPLVPKPPAQAASPQPAAPVAQASPQPDELSEMVSQIADQVKREALEEAELIKEALREIDIEPAPRRPEEAPEAAAPREDNGVAESGARPPVAVGKKPATGEGPTAAQPLSLSDRLSVMARTLPKEPDPALYSHILDQLGEGVDAVREAIDAVRRDYTAKHRSTAGLKKFLEWLK